MASASQAYFDPTMLALLYFPDEHKYTVYAPFFGPVAVPLLAALAKEVKVSTKRWSPVSTGSGRTVRRLTEALLVKQTWKEKRRKAKEAAAGESAPKEKVD